MLLVRLLLTSVIQIESNPLRKHSLRNFEGEREIKKNNMSKSLNENKKHLPKNNQPQIKQLY